MKRLRLAAATWNVHGFVGADGRRDRERTAALLSSLGADILALQEVDAGTDAGSDAFDTLGGVLGDFHAIAGPTLERHTGRYGNLLLTRFPARRVARIDLSQPGCEPRGAIDARLEVAGVPVRVLATHLGLRRRERALQARRLCDALDEAGPARGLVLLLGDLNEWRPLRGTGLAPLSARFAHRSRRRTFPARAPLLALDRVLVAPAQARVSLHTVGGVLARAASDHLPLCARIEWERG